MQRIIRAILVAILFVGSGLLTFQIYAQVGKSGDAVQNTLQFVIGIPFGLVCSLRFVRPWKWVPVVVLLDCLTWVVAFRLGLGLAGKLNPYFAMAVAGMVGSLGVTAAAGLGCRVLYERRGLLGAALVGALTGLPFGLVMNRSAQEDLILAISFPLWQIAVGLWIGKSGKRF